MRILIHPNSRELNEEEVCRYFRHTTQHGAMKVTTKDKEVKYYNLRAIMAVGYGVNSHRAIGELRHQQSNYATSVLGY